MFRRSEPLYHSRFNSELIFPEYSYGMFYLSAEKLGYKIRIAPANSARGEKIRIGDLENFIKINPKAKTLYLEAKTLSGLFYTKSELFEVIQLCKDNNIFLLFDIAHIGLELNDAYSQSTITLLCQQIEFFSYAILYTASKNYGFSEGRIGFCISDKRATIHTQGRERVSVFSAVRSSMFYLLGTTPIQPVLLAEALIKSPIENRVNFRNNLRKKHKLNLALMIAYIEGAISQHIEESQKAYILDNIPTPYQRGIQNLKLIAIPEGGMQVKVDISYFIDKFFMHFHITSS